MVDSRHMVDSARFVVAVVVVVVVGGLAACCCSCADVGDHGAMRQPAKVRAMVPIQMPDPSDQQPMDFPGIHNAVAFGAGFVSGSQPEGDAGFDTLAAMGVKTIISVDGAAPDVDSAMARGIRTVHLPIGYNGFGEERKLQLVRATRDAIGDGAVYIHCHHGKHRSAGAAATIAASLGWMTPAQGVSRMNISGTSPQYAGLFACAASATVLDKDIIDDVPAEFPSASKPSGFVHGMIEIDEAFDHLKDIERAGWATPRDHPDLVPAAEAGRLADLFRDLNESAFSRGQPREFTEMMAGAHAGAQSLEDALIADARSQDELTLKFKHLGASCKECHAKFRD